MPGRSDRSSPVLYAFAVILAAAVVLPLWRPCSWLPSSPRRCRARTIAWLAGSVAGGPVGGDLHAGTRGGDPVARRDRHRAGRRPSLPVGRPCPRDAGEERNRRAVAAVADQVERWIHLRYDDVIARPRELWSHTRALSGAQWALGAAAAAVQALWHISFSLIMMLSRSCSCCATGTGCSSGSGGKLPSPLTSSTRWGHSFIGREVGHRR